MVLLYSVQLYGIWKFYAWLESLFFDECPLIILWHVNENDFVDVMGFYF